MATYVMLIKFTAPGMESILDAQKGRAAGKKAAKALGITWKQQYLLMGEYDAMLLVEAPNEETMAVFVLLGGMSGSFKTQTMRAFTEAEADKLIKSLQQGPSSASSG